MAGRNPLARLTTDRDRHGLSLPRGERVGRALRQRRAAVERRRRGRAVGRLVACLEQRVAQLGASAVELGIGEAA